MIKSNYMTKFLFSIFNIIDFPLSFSMSYLDWNDLISSKKNIESFVFTENKILKID